HEREVAAEALAVDRPRRLAHEIALGRDHHGGERDQGYEGLEEHGPVSDGRAVRLFLDLLRSRARADEPVEARARAAGDGHEQEREERAGSPSRLPPLERLLLHGEAPEEEGDEARST